MVDKQPKALSIADWLDEVNAVSHPIHTKSAAAELRRLHEVNVELVKALEAVIRGVPDTWEGVQKAKVVLDKAKENNHG